MAAAEVVGGGEDEVGALHVEVFGAERLAGGGFLRQARDGLGDVVALAIAHEKRPGEGAGWEARGARASARSRSGMLRVVCRPAGLSAAAAPSVEMTSFLVGEGFSSTGMPLRKVTVRPGMAGMRSPGTRMPARFKGSAAETVIAGSSAREAC